MKALACIVIVMMLAPAAAAEDGDPFDGRTVTVQVGGGVAGGLLFGGGGGLVGGLIGSSIAGRADWGPPLAGAAIGITLGGITGVIVGVKKSGEWLDGTGTWAGTTVGALGGLTATILLAQSRTMRRLPVGAIIGIASVLLLAPPIIGYHLTAEDRIIATPLTVAF